MTITSRHRRVLTVVVTGAVMLTACGGSTDSSSESQVPLAKNSALKKAISKPGGGSATTTTVVNTAAALNGVGKQYRNSSGQVVDGHGIVVTALPSTWPSAVSAEFLRLVSQEAERQLVSAAELLKQQTDAWKSASASDVERAANALLSKYPAKWPKLAIGGGTNMEFAPVASPITVKVQPAQWTSSSSMNLLATLNFMGVRAYETPIGCLSLAAATTTGPVFTFNGSC